MTARGIDFGPAQDSDCEPAGLVLSRAFGFTAEQAGQWMRDKVTLPESRVLREGGVAVATAMRVPMGIWLGGVAVPQAGIAGVAVAPEARGRGLAREVMRRCLLEMHERGEAISTLYSAMHPLYRSVGYETAGNLFSARVPAGMIAATDRGADWRPMTDADLPAVQACARERARLTPAALDRGPYVWDRVLRSKDGPAEAFVAEDGSGRVEAYAIYRVQPRTDGPTTGSGRGRLMELVDFGYASGHGLDRLLGFLRGFSSVVGEILMAEHPASPLLARLPDRRYSLAVHDSWMLRVVDVSRALEARGYAPDLTCAFTIRVDDPLLEANTRPLRVTIEAGSARVERAGGSKAGEAIEMKVGVLAPILTGMQSASLLARVGLVRGPARDLGALDAAMACAGGPCMFDFF